MKKLSWILILTFFTLIAFAQSDRYLTTMEQTIGLIDTAGTTATFQKAANTFERIAAAEAKQWLPVYYVAYCRARQALGSMNGDSEKMFALVEEAQAALDKAIAISGENSEILALQAYIYHLQVWGNPQANGPVFVPKANEVLQKAIALDGDNPRPYHLLGQNLFFTPAFWGGGAEAAKPHLEEAQQRFDNFKGESSIHPKWGAGWNKELLARANKSDKE